MEASVQTGVLTDDSGRAGTVFTLGPYRGTNTVEVSALGYSATFNAVAGSPVNLPDPLLRAVIEKTLDKVSGEPISQAEMATLTYTERGSWSLGISDLTGLEFAINFTHLDLNDNSLTDISAPGGTYHADAARPWQQFNCGYITISGINRSGTAFAWEQRNIQHLARFGIGQLEVGLS